MYADSLFIVSPNGIMFVKPEIRKSLLAKMLAELLDTRVMIKRTMKDYKEDSVSHKLFFFFLSLIHKNRVF
jgi:DNA polymerase elongation subunit (family B)